MKTFQEVRVVSILTMKLTQENHSSNKYKGSMKADNQPEGQSVKIRKLSQEQTNTIVDLFQGNKIKTIGLSDNLQIIVEYTTPLNELKVIKL